MPSTTIPASALSEMTRDEAIGLERWIRMIESRGERLVAVMDSMGLGILGDLVLFGRPIKQYRGVIESDLPGRPLSATGVFGFFEERSGSQRTWGFTKFDGWVLVTVELDPLADPRAHPNRMVGAMDVSSTTLPRLIDTHRFEAVDIWSRIGQAFGSWQQRCRQAYEEASRACAVIDAEDLAMAAWRANRA